MWNFCRDRRDGEWKNSFVLKSALHSWPGSCPVELQSDLLATKQLKYLPQGQQWCKFSLLLACRNLLSMFSFPLLVNLANFEVFCEIEMLHKIYFGEVLVQCVALLFLPFWAIYKSISSPCYFCTWQTSLFLIMFSSGEMNWTKGVSDVTFICSFEMYHANCASDFFLTFTSFACQQDNGANWRRSCDAVENTR